MCIRDRITAGTVGAIAKTGLSAIKSLPGINLAASALNAVMAATVVEMLGQMTILLFENIKSGKISLDKYNDCLLYTSFNHCGSFNKWLDRECIYEDAPGYEKGAFVSKDSPYRTFFKFREDTWPYNVNYDGWWGHDTLPKLNYEESPKLYEYIMRIARKWVSPPVSYTHLAKYRDPQVSRVV